MESKETILGKIMGKVVGLRLEVLRALYDLVEKLASGNEWIGELKKFLRKEKCWTDVIVETLLELMGIVEIPVRSERFIARDHFVVDTSERAKIKISYLGDNFKKEFLNKIEEALMRTEFRYHKLRKGSLDEPIINELGGKESAEIALLEMFSLLEAQPKGEFGTLLTNGYANIFYIRNSAGALRTVLCYWDDDGWIVDANSVESPVKWDAGDRVFSRNYLKTKS